MARIAKILGVSSTIFDDNISIHWEDTKGKRGTTHLTGEYVLNVARQFVRLVLEKTNAKVGKQVITSFPFGVKCDFFFSVI